MRLGVVGLPNVGKSTLFNAITNAGAESANYPFCTIEPNVGIVDVPDERLETLSKLYSAKKTTPAQIEFVDIAGLVKGASKGEGLGNKFLSHIREVDAIVHVVRCFDDQKVIHVEGSVSPSRDIQTINLELILADLESLTKYIEKENKQLKAGVGAKENIVLLNKIKATLENEKPVRSLKFTEKEKEYVESLFLLTTKPVIYVANISEDDILKEPIEIAYVKEVIDFASTENGEVLTLSCKIEEELTALDVQDRQIFKEELGINKSGLEKLIMISYKTLGLMSYLTAGEKEVRAWTINVGTKAPQAAGKIHSDFEKGFIRAEIVKYDDLISLGSLNSAKEKGKVQSVGKEYVMQDGDVCLFKFNV
ncbi:MAG: redox-regulated ATPase YchF [Clostridia bacterium]|nr:redox-regulated ATPase YchF [Clostridia bacterium]